MSKNILVGLIILVFLGGIVFLSLGINKSNKLKNELNFRENDLIDNSSTLDNNQKRGNSMGVGQGSLNNRQNCLADECLAIDDLEYPVTDLSEEARDALTKALDDEYKAYSTYESVIDKLGNVRPFIMIIRSEEQHISSLKALFDKYGMDIPENPYSNVEVPDTLAESCSIGVQAEIENAKLYEENLLPSVKEYQDITLVFNNLMNASQTKHLTAFQRCSR